MSVSTVQVAGYRCVEHTVLWRYRFGVAARWLRGNRLLVAADNFWVPSNHPLLGLVASRNAPRSPELLSPYLISRAHPVVQGEFELNLSSPTGMLVYTDPLGAGVLAWRFRAPQDADSYPTPGSFCLATIGG